MDCMNNTNSEDTKVEDIGILVIELEDSFDEIQNDHNYCLEEIPKNQNENNATLTTEFTNESKPPEANTIKKKLDTLELRKLCDNTKWKKNIEEMKHSKSISNEIPNNLRLDKLPRNTDYLCSCRYGCTNQFSIDERIEICKEYWGLTNYVKQKDFILNHVYGLEPKRKMKNTKSPKNISRIYSFAKKDFLIRVCKKFFLDTLCISNGPVNKAFEERSDCNKFEGVDKRGRHDPKNKCSDMTIKQIKSHIESFPVVYSQYLEKKYFLDSNLSLAKMYILYREHAEKNGYTPVHQSSYRRYFRKHYNYYFFKLNRDRKKSKI